MPTIKIRKYLSSYEYLSNNTFLKFVQNNILEISKVLSLNMYFTLSFDEVK